MSVLKLKIGDLRLKAIELFKDKAEKSGRLTQEEARIEDSILFENLHLIDEEGYLIKSPKIL